MTTTNKWMTDNKELAVAEAKIYYAMEHLKFAIRHAYARSSMSTDEYKNRMLDLAVAAQELPHLVGRFVAIVLYEVDEQTKKEQGDA